MCPETLLVRVTLRQQMVGSGEAFGGIAFGEEDDVKAKITMKPRRDRPLGGGGKWRELGGVERREGERECGRETGENQPCT